MPTYRLRLPVRAIGAYRLPDAGVTADKISLVPATPPAYTAKVEPVEAASAESAYAEAQRIADQFLSYLTFSERTRPSFSMDVRAYVRRILILNKIQFQLINRLRPLSPFLVRLLRQGRR